MLELFDIIQPSLKDAIDILLVTILLYYIYRLMKASSSANIFTGVLVFVIVWIMVSHVFQMRLLGGILDKLVNVGSIALIILFQEEIRQFFSGLGTRQRVGRLLNFFKIKKDKQKSHREDILPIVIACMNMGRQKIGALIIIERGIALGDIAQSGEDIDATISQRLIENIFFKNSPLHDGAMIISGGRIKAAGCILPVAHDSDIPKTLGLRHRAGLGMSQKSDCLSIIVSEETGHISIAENGTFHLNLTAEELESRLAEGTEAL